MTLPVLGSLESLPALDHPDLLGPTVAAALADWPGASEVAVAEIDPELADTAACAAAYVAAAGLRRQLRGRGGRRDGQERVAACVVRADTRADVNNLVKRTLDVRKASFLSMDRAVEESSMEYGGITPVGLPDGWRLLVDRRVIEIDVAIIGSGVRRSKLLLPGRLLAELPGRRGGRRPGRSARELKPRDGHRSPTRNADVAIPTYAGVTVVVSSTPVDNTARKGAACRSRCATSPCWQWPCWCSRWP